MRVPWLLRGGENIEIYDGQDPPAKDKVLVYRICVDRLVQAEVKIVRGGAAKPKMITKESRSPVLDVATNAALYLEVVGKDGFAGGWYEVVAAL